MNKQLVKVFREIYKNHNCDWVKVKAEIEKAFSQVQRESADEIKVRKPNELPQQMKRKINESDKLKKLIALVEQYTNRKVILK